MKTEPRPKKIQLTQSKAQLVSKLLAKLKKIERDHHHTDMDFKQARQIRPIHEILTRAPVKEIEPKFSDLFNMND